MFRKRFAFLTSRGTLMEQLNKKISVRELPTIQRGPKILKEIGSNVKDDERPVNEADHLESGRDAEPTKSSETPKLKDNELIRLNGSDRKGTNTSLNKVGTTQVDP